MTKTAKQDVAKMLDGLPENVTFEDIQYHLYVLEKVNKGKARLEEEGGISQEEVEQWLNISEFTRINPCIEKHQTTIRKYF